MIALTERQRNILFCVVELYNATGEAVGSAAVSRQPSIGVSSATVRNVMAELEEAELLVQPHTSAGRLPTAAGMRLFVNFLMQTGRIRESGPDFQALHRLEESDVDAIVRSAGLVVSRLSSLTSIVSSPRVNQVGLREIQLTFLSERRVLVLLISEDGRVFNRVVRVEEPLRPDDVARMQSFLSELVVGKSLKEVRRRVKEQLRAAETQYRLGIRQALRIGQEALEEAARAELFVEGALQLLEFAEFSQNIERVRGLLRHLEDRERVLQVLDSLCDQREVQTLIGPELGNEWGADLSLIACGYSQDGRQAGLVGVLGPIRMDYARIIPLVEEAARVLSKELDDLA